MSNESLESHLSKYDNSSSQLLDALQDEFTEVMRTAIQKQSEKSANFNSSRTHFPPCPATCVIRTHSTLPLRASFLSCHPPQGTPRKRPATAKIRRSKVSMDRISFGPSAPTDHVQFISLPSDFDAAARPGRNPTSGVYRCACSRVLFFGDVTHAIWLGSVR